MYIEKHTVPWWEHHRLTPTFIFITVGLFIISAEHTGELHSGHINIVCGLGIERTRHPECLPEHHTTTSAGSRWPAAGRQGLNWGDVWPARNPTNGQNGCQPSGLDLDLWDQGLEEIETGLTGLRTRYNNGNLYQPDVYLNVRALWFNQTQRNETRHYYITERTKTKNRGTIPSWTVGQLHLLLRITCQWQICQPNMWLKD